MIAALVIFASPAAVTSNVRSLATTSIRTFVKVAIPATAATVVVPSNSAPATFGVSASVTLPVNPVAMLPSASFTNTCSAGAIVAPAVTEIGTAPSSIRSAADDDTAKSVLVCSIVPTVARNV